MHIEKESNVKKDKVIKESMGAATETTSHEINLPGSNINPSHMSAKSVVKIATLSRATPHEGNHTVSPSYSTAGKQTAAHLPTISFGFVFFF